MFLVIWRIFALIRSIFEYSAVINFVKIMTTKQFQIQEGRKIFKTCKPEMPMDKRIEKLMRSGIATNCIPIILDHIDPKIVYNYIKQILTRKPKWLNATSPLKPTKNQLKRDLTRRINRIKKYSQSKDKEFLLFKLESKVKIKPVDIKIKQKENKKKKDKRSNRRKYQIPPDMPKKMLHRIITRMRIFKKKSFITVDYDHVDVWNHIKANPYCYITGEYIDILKPNSFSLDHFVAPCKGGSSNLYNMRICKPIFNTMKWDQNFDDFVENCQKVIEFQKSIYLD